MTAAEPILIDPKPRDVGGFDVRRALPAPQCRAVGPFVFFDQMGPVTFAPGQGIDVRPHPHIGLATITWLIGGEIMHRDSLGYAQAIRPGEVNWMTAGRGIVHSERSPDSERAGNGRLFGIQSWVALPTEQAECAPSFQHYPADGIPQIERSGARISLVVGEGWGACSPVATPMSTFYADIRLEADAELTLPAEVAERAVYTLAGDLEADGTAVPAGRMAVLAAAAEGTLRAGPDGAHLIALGGEPLDGPRTLWWNFVAADPARIEQAKADWKAGRFDPVPGDDEFIPLPER